MNNFFTGSTEWMHTANNHLGRAWQCSIEARARASFYASVSICENDSGSVFYRREGLLCVRAIGVPLSAPPHEGVWYNSTRSQKPVQKPHQTGPFSLLTQKKKMPQKTSVPFSLLLPTCLHIVAFRTSASTNLKMLYKQHSHQIQNDPEALVSF